jgi:hypothetical protein
MSAAISIRIIPRSGKDLGVEISFGEWMMRVRRIFAFGQMQPQ